jgi:hypothetical protein
LPCQKGKHSKTRKMKKLGLMIMVLLFTGMGMVNAQQGQQGMRPMQQYMQTEVMPVVKAEQAKLEAALTASEQKELAKLKEEMKAYQAQGKQIRESMNGNFNQQVWDTRKAALAAIKVKADKLVAAHPQEAKAYKEAVDKILAQMPQGRMGMQQGRMGTRGGNRGMRAQGAVGGPQTNMMNRLSDPAFALLIDANHFGMQNRRMAPQKGQRGMRQGRGMQQNRQMGMQGRQGMNRQQGMRGQNRMNRSQGRFSRWMAMRNPEVRAKVEAYAKENIFPVLSKERTAFDAKLSNKEKKQIAAARKQWEARRAMIQKRMQDPNFVPGQRLNDSTRMAMRLEMQKTMLPVREIALKHYTEIKSVLTQIKGQNQQWRADIRAIVNPQNQGPRPLQRNIADKHRQNGTILFLMYDPANPQLPFMK